MRFSGFDYKLEDIHPSRVDDSIFVQGAKWAQPVEKDVISRLVKIKKSYKVPKSWAESGKEYINSNFNQNKIFEKYDQVLSGYLA